MEETLRILIVEDSPADAELVIREFRRTCPLFSHAVCENADEVRAAMAQHSWDAVLSDYSLPGFDALNALEIVRAADPHVPFVVTSGTIGEERAVELMRAGVTDFVMKGHPARVVSVTERAVHEARDQARLLDTEEQLLLAVREWQDTFDAISDGILILNAVGDVRRANRAVKEHMGLDNVMGMSAREILERLRPGAGNRPVVFDPVHNQRFEWGPCSAKRWYSVSVDPVGSPGETIDGYTMVFTDISLRRHSENELQNVLERLRRTMQGSVAIAVHMVESRDPYTAGHQEGVAELAVKIAQRMGLPSHDVEQIEIASLLHDIGKIAVPAEILVRPGGLQDIEWAMIRRHPEVGAEILADAEFDGPIRETVWQHHERLDGTGYPRGLSGDEVSLDARIVMVADVAEAMMGHRPYRPACSVEEIRMELYSGSGKRYDPAAVDACLEVLAELP